MVDRVVQYPGRYVLTPVPGLTNGFTITASPGTITHAGTLINRALFIGLMPIQYFDVVVPTTAWVSDNTYAAIGFLFRASILMGVANTLAIPFVTFNPVDALTKGLAPIAVAHPSGIYIYAKRALTANITIPTIELSRNSSAI